VTDNAQPVREKTGNKRDRTNDADLYKLIRGCILDDAQHRLADFLLSLDTYGIFMRNRTIADHLGWSVGKVKRVLASLEAKGVISIIGETSARRIEINWDVIRANQRVTRINSEPSDNATRLNSEPSDDSQLGSSVNELGSSVNASWLIREPHIRAGFSSKSIYPPTPHASHGGSGASAASRRNARTSKPKGNGSILSDQAVMSLGIKYEMQARPGETMDAYRARVLSEDRRRRKDG